MKNAMFWAVLIIGIILALATGGVNTTPGGLVGAVWYGAPTPWLFYLVIGPQYNPWMTNWAGLIIDIVIWTGIMMAIALVGKSLARK